MAVDELRILIRAIFEGKGFQRARSELNALQQVSKRTGVGLGVTQKGFRTMDLEVNKSGRVVNAFNKQFADTEKTFMGVRKQSRMFRMELLGLMFGMMMINRIAVTFLRSLFVAYNKAHEEQEGFTRATDKLTAAWTFFKYSLIDALMRSDLFKNLVDWLTNMLDKLSGMSENTRLWLVKIIAGVAIISGIGFAFASLGLLWGSISLMMGLQGKGMFYGLALAANAFKRVAVRAFTIVAAHPVVALILVIVAATLAIYNLQKAVGGLGVFFKMVLGGIIFVAAIAADFFYNVWRGAINGVIWLLNKLLSLWNKLAESRLGKLLKLPTLKIPDMPDIRPQILGGAKSYEDFVRNWMRTTPFFAETAARGGEAAEGGIWNALRGLTTYGDKAPIEINIENEFDIDVVGDVSTTQIEEMMSQFEDKMEGITDKLKREINVSGY